MAKYLPGQSGNPKGRPPKQRALTSILEMAGDKTVEVDGKKIARKRLVAQMVWEAATTGGATFADGTRMLVPSDEWLAIVKFIYAQIDGPPPQRTEISGPNGEPISFEAGDVLAGRIDSLAAKLRAGEAAGTSGADEEGAGVP